MSVFFKKSFPSFSFLGSSLFSLLSSLFSSLFSLRGSSSKRTSFPRKLLLLSFFVFLMFSKKEGKQQHRETISSSYQPRRILFVSVGIILYIHTSSIERREKERLAEKASSSSQSDFEEEEE